MDRWEYMSIWAQGTEELDKKLNTLGDLGWEAVGVLDSRDGYTVLLKRRKP